MPQRFSAIKDSLRVPGRNRSVSLNLDGRATGIDRILAE